VQQINGFLAQASVAMHAIARQGNAKAIYPICLLHVRVCFFWNRACILLYVYKRANPRVENPGNEQKEELMTQVLEPQEKVAVEKKVSLTKILVTTDFSPESERAARPGAAL
jgi:hypothetical protein